MATYDVVGVGEDDGVQVGVVSTTPLGFFGTTPVVRYATSIPAPISTAAVSFSATQWGFTSSAQADGIIRTVVRLQAALSGQGFIIG